MDIFPVWRTTYYDTVEDSITFRITNDDGEEIYRARADRRPDEDIMRINLNKPCQNALDSMLSGWNGESDVVVPQNAYMVFHLQFPDGDGWETVYSFAFVNDWSYEDHQGNEYSEPINGHAAPGMFLPYSYLVTGDSETICYRMWEPYFIITYGENATFTYSGGTWIISYESEGYSGIHYSHTLPDGTVVTGIPTGNSVVIEIPENEDFREVEHVVVFYDGNGNELGRATATITMEGREYLKLRIVSGGTLEIRSKNPGWVEANRIGELYYSKDSGETWQHETVYPSSSYTIQAEEGEEYWFFGHGHYGLGTTSAWGGWWSFYQSTAYFEAFGDPYALYGWRSPHWNDGYHWHNGANIPGDFHSLFHTTNITNASELIMPDTSAAEVFKAMFAYCEHLVKGPVLHGDTVGYGACNQMYVGCTSLYYAPDTTPLYPESYVLPAETIDTYGYYGMFSGCTSLRSIRVGALKPKNPGTEASGQPALEPLSYMLSGIDTYGALYIKNGYTIAPGAPSRWNVVYYD